jgi:cobalt/nickel transport system permease protein
VSTVIDRYAYLRSPIHFWELRTKLVSFGLLILAFSTLKHPALLLSMAVITVSFVWRSRLPWSHVAQYWRYPGLLIGFLLLITPWITEGTVLWQWGNLSLTQEGCLRVVQIGSRFLCIVTLSVVLFGTAPLARSLRAMQALGVPSLLVDMGLLTYRYLQEFNRTRKTMQQAMCLRGFQPQQLSRRNLRIWAQLAGSLLLRSYDQSIRVYQAMMARGYGQRSAAIALTKQQPLDRASVVNFVLCITLALGLAIGQFLLT